MPNRINYQLEMEKVLRTLDGTRPRLLLHACCAPCSSATLERLAAHFDITVLYYNPNIYRRRSITAARPSWSALSSRRGITIPSLSCPTTRRSFTLPSRGWKMSRKRAHAAPFVIGCGWSRPPAMPPRTALTGTAQRSRSPR